MSPEQDAPTECDHKGTRKRVDSLGESCLRCGRYTEPPKDDHEKCPCGQSGDPADHDCAWSTRYKGDAPTEKCHEPMHPFRVNCLLPKGHEGDHNMQASPIPDATESRWAIGDYIVNPGDGEGRWYLYDLHEFNDGPPCAEFYDERYAREVCKLLNETEGKP